MTITLRGRAARGTLGALIGCYLLIAFEFFYMATPFAGYVYGAYRPGLDVLMRWPLGAWLTRFFLPHYVVASSSLLIRLHEPVGVALLGVGLAVFAFGAGQVYWAKLTRRGPVTGGLYRFLRHPQYAGLGVGGLGLLLLWPRFIALVLFVSMLFGYLGLARLEELSCERTFGQPYLDYQRRTGMFLPGRLGWTPSVGGWGMVGLYLLSLAVAVGMGRWLAERTVNSLEARYSENAVYVSVADIDPAALSRLVALAAAEPTLHARLEAGGSGSSRFINYVLPADWYVPEIPMSAPPGADCHHTPKPSDSNRYRIVFTRVELGCDASCRGRELLLRAATRTPVVEAWFDLGAGRLERWAEASNQAAYAGARCRCSDACEASARVGQARHLAVSARRVHDELGMASLLTVGSAWKFATRTLPDSGGTSSRTATRLRSATPAHG
jgi:protein-S-isoprenylcysteine O-methyltransferase Ste14